VLNAIGAAVVLIAVGLGTWAVYRALG
jgi:hypothetical protein